uniref:Uncharacterized protein n=1 Tax=Cacopsylla melanoneura TaxID=428564 RepID=A0A8D8TRQ9_9HEMI
MLSTSYLITIFYYIYSKRNYFSYLYSPRLMATFYLLHTVRLCICYKVSATKCCGLLKFSLLKGKQFLSADEYTNPNLYLYITYFMFYLYNLLQRYIFRVCRDIGGQKNKKKGLKTRKKIST